MEKQPHAVQNGKMSFTTDQHSHFAAILSILKEGKLGKGPEVCCTDSQLPVGHPSSPELNFILNLNTHP